MCEIDLRTILFVIGTGAVVFIGGVLIGYIGKCL